MSFKTTICSWSFWGLIIFGLLCTSGCTLKSNPSYSSPEATIHTYYTSRDCIQVKEAYHPKLTRDSFCNPRFKEYRIISKETRENDEPPHTGAPPLLRGDVEIVVKSTTSEFDTIYHWYALRVFSNNWRIISHSYMSTWSGWEIEAGIENSSRYCEDGDYLGGFINNSGELIVDHSHKCGITDELAKTVLNYLIQKDTATPNLYPSSGGLYYDTENVRFYPQQKRIHLIAINEADPPHQRVIVYYNFPYDIIQLEFALALQKQGNHWKVIDDYLPGE